MAKEQLLDLHAVFPDLTGRIAQATRYPKSTRAYDPEDVVLILHSSGSTGLPKPVP